MPPNQREACKPQLRPYTVINKLFIFRAEGRERFGRVGSRERRNPLWQHLNPREEQRGKGWALARPPPPAGHFAITGHTCSWVTVGHASWPLLLRAPPNPDFCSSLPKIAMLCSKAGTRAPEAMQRGFCLEDVREGLG